MNIFVGSLPFSLEETELRGFFEEYGEVTSVKIITDKFSGRSKGFGFVEMPDDEQAKKAIEELNGAELDGRTIVVNKSEEKKDGERKPFRPSNNRPGGGGGYNRGGDNRGGGDRGGNRGGYRGSNDRGGNGGGSSDRSGGQRRSY